MPPNLDFASAARSTLLSSRPERPGFFLRAALWRAGSRSGGTTATLRQGSPLVLYRVTSSLPYLSSYSYPPSSPPSASSCSTWPPPQSTSSVPASCHPPPAEPSHAAPPPPPPPPTLPDRAAPAPA